MHESSKRPGEANETAVCTPTPQSALFRAQDRRALELLRPRPGSQSPQARHRDISLRRICDIAITHTFSPVPSLELTLPSSPSEGWVARAVSRKIWESRPRTYPPAIDADLDRCVHLFPSLRQHGFGPSSPKDEPFSCPDQSLTVVFSPPPPEESDPKALHCPCRARSVIRTVRQAVKLFIHPIELIAGGVH